jgi:hypothetical protein
MPFAENCGGITLSGIIASILIVQSYRRSDRACFKALFHLFGSESDS